MACTASKRVSFLCVYNDVSLSLSRRKTEWTYCDVFNAHLPVPHTRKLVVYLSGLFVFDGPANRIVSTGKVALGLELNVRNQVILRASDIAVISQLILHFPEENAAGVHVGLRQDTTAVSTEPEIHKG